MGRPIGKKKVVGANPGFSAEGENRYAVGPVGPNGIGPDDPYTVALGDGGVRKPVEVRLGKMVTPEQLASSGTEHGEQAALFCWATQQMKIAGFEGLDWMFAVPNGGARDRVTAGMLKAEGVKPGISDIVLPVARGGYFGLMLEMKRKNGGVISPNQVAFRAHCVREGYAHVLAHGWEQARNGILIYMGWPKTQIFGERARP